MNRKLEEGVIHNVTWKQKKVGSILMWQYLVLLTVVVYWKELLQNKLSK